MLILKDTLVKNQNPENASGFGLFVGMFGYSFEGG